MQDSPKSSTHLPLRCCAKVGARPVAWCGDPAPLVAPATPIAPEAFYCAAHMTLGCQPAAGARSVRRVRVVLSLDLAGVSFLPADAHTEAVDRLVRACQAVGAVVNLLDVGSVMVENPPELAAGETLASGGRG